MNLAADTIFESDEPLIKSVFDSLKSEGLPNYILQLKLEKGEDIDGDSFWWIWVSVPKELHPSKKNIRRYLAFGDRLENKLRDAGIGARPLVRFSEYRSRVKRNAAAA